MSDFPFFGARTRYAPKSTSNKKNKNNNLGPRLSPGKVYNMMLEAQAAQERRRRLNPGKKFERNHTKKNASPNNLFFTPTGSPEAEADYSTPMAALRIQNNPLYEPTSTRTGGFKPFSTNYTAKPKATKRAKPKATKPVNKPFTAFTVGHKNRACAKDAVEHAVNCMSLTKPQIQDMLRARGLKVTGTKAELCARLVVNA